MHDPIQQLNTLANVLIMRAAQWLQSSSNGRIRQPHLRIVSAISSGALIWAFWSNLPLVAVVLLAYGECTTALGNALHRIQNKLPARTGADYTTVIRESVAYLGLGLYVYKHTPMIDLWLVIVAGISSILVAIISTKSTAEHKTPQNKKLAHNETSIISTAKYELRLLLLLAGLLLGILAPFLRLLVALNAVVVAAHYTSLNSSANRKKSK